MDNVMIERLWRSVKHEEVYLKAYDTVKQAKQSIAEYLDFSLYTTNFTEPLSYQGSAFLKLPKFP